MVDLADSKNDGVVLDADSDALIRFSIFYLLRVLFPPEVLPFRKPSLMFLMMKKISLIIKKNVFIIVQEAAGRVWTQTMVQEITNHSSKF